MQPSDGDHGAGGRTSEVRAITPAVFVSHGAPTTALDPDCAKVFAAWAGSRPRPRAAVVLSAHAERDGPVRVNSALRPEMAYDFHGFEPSLYALRYPAPGSPALAAGIVTGLKEAGIDALLDRTSSWDHGVWVPLRLLFPAADVPVVALSLPVPRSIELLVRMGRALAPLRSSGILLLGSGGIVHNLRRLSWDDPQSAPESWAQRFDAWVEERLAALDLDGLQSYREAAPQAALAVPSAEHFDPLFFVLGSRGPDDRVETIYEGFRYGTVSMRSFALVAA
jgi:4,5-DOPA dioxygenase extradiol